MQSSDLRKAIWWPWLALALVASLSPMLQAAAADVSRDAPGIEFFEQKVRPLLASTCYQCHGRESKNLKGGLLLDSGEGLLKGGDSGPVLVTGDPDQSLLIKAVRYQDKDLRMPPDGKKRLTAAQVADLEAWVKMGAPLPRAGAVARRHDQGESTYALGLSTGDEPRGSHRQEPGLDTIAR